MGKEMIPHLDKFLSYQQNRAHSNHTLKAYRADLGLFWASCPVKAPGDCKRSHVASFLTGLQSLGLKPGSVRRKVAAISTYFVAMIYSDVCENNPCIGVMRPKSPRRLPKPFTRDEIKSMLNEKIAINKRLKRAHMLAHFFYGTGARLAEVASITAAMVKPGVNSISIIGKGNKERMLILNPQLLDRLTQWCGDNPTTDGNIWGASAATIRSDIKLLGKKACVYNVYPHRLRHSFATHLCDAGVDIEVVQQLMGHASISTTQGYTAVSTQKLHDAINKFRLEA